jgi:hypothetical protein
VFADAKDFSTAATPSVEMTEEVGKKDNTEVGVFADAKDFSTNARNDGRRAVGTDVKKPLSQCSDTDSSPLGGGADNEVL